MIPGPSLGVLLSLPLLPPNAQPSVELFIPPCPLQELYLVHITNRCEVGLSPMLHAYHLTTLWRRRKPGVWRDLEEAENNGDEM